MNKLINYGYLEVFFFLKKKLFRIGVAKWAILKWTWANEGG